MPQTKTRMLMADLATALKLPALPPDDNNGYQLTIGGETTVFIYGEADERLLIVAPVGKLPPGIGFGLALYLLGRNMFNADLTPFQVATDAGGGVVLWGRLGMGEVSGQSLVGVLGVLADRAAEIRGELAAAA